MTKTIQLKTLFPKPPKEKEDPDKKVKTDPEEDPKEIDPKEIDLLENKENLENLENLGNQEVKEDLKIRRLLLNEKNLIYKLLFSFFLGAKRRKSNKN